MRRWYPYRVNKEGKLCFDGVYFSSISEPIITIREDGDILLLKKKGSTVYVPRKMVYSPPELFLIRRLALGDDGYYQTELIEGRKYNRSNAKYTLQYMNELMDRIKDSNLVGGKE